MTKWRRNFACGRFLKAEPTRRWYCEGLTHQLANHSGPSVLPRPTCQCLTLLPDTSRKPTAVEDGLPMPSTFLNRPCFYHTPCFSNPRFRLHLLLASSIFPVHNPCLPLPSTSRKPALEACGRQLWRPHAKRENAARAPPCCRQGSVEKNARICTNMHFTDSVCLFMNLFWTCIHSYRNAVIQFCRIWNVHVPKFQNFQSPWRRFKCNCGCQLVSPPAFLISVRWHCW